MYASLKNRRLFLVSVFFIMAVLIFSTLLNTGFFDWSTDITVRSDRPILNDDGATPDSVRATVDASNQYAFELYSKYSIDEENLLYSPHSISTALSMVYEGARGKTAEEIQNTFHLQQEDTERRPAIARIYNLLNEETREYLLHTANALWIQEDFPITEEYVDTIKNYYGGEAKKLSFDKEPEESRIQINKWVEEKTNEKIKDLFPSGSIRPDVVLVLTNAIYFKGEWVTEFDEDKTRTEEFYVNNTRSVEVDMMCLLETKFNYTETEEMEILELPYKGKDVSMIILLPKENNIHDVEETLSLENYYDLIDELEENTIDVYLPRFKYETKYYMKKDLEEMGMPLAFTPSADFAGITDRNIWIDKVIHQAFIEVNEEGTEAAAATGVSVVESAPISKVFRADHPFLFLIQDRHSGLILFMGRVLDPT